MIPKLETIACSISAVQENICRILFKVFANVESIKQLRPTTKLGWSVHESFYEKGQPIIEKYGMFPDCKTFFSTCVPIFEACPWIQLMVLV